MKIVRTLIACLLLLCTVSLASAAGEFDAKERYEFGLQPGENTIILDDDDTYATQLTVYSKRSLLAQPSVYKLQKEPIARYQIPRTALQYFAIEEPALTKYIMEWAEIIIRIPSDDIRNIGANQLALYVYDATIEEYVRVDFSYLGVRDDVHSWKATTNLLGYFALAKLESYEIVTDVIGNPSTNRLAVVTGSTGDNSDEASSNDGEQSTQNEQEAIETTPVDTNSVLETNTNSESIGTEVVQSEPELQSPTQQTQSTISALLSDPIVLIAIAAFIASAFVAVGILLFSRKKTTKKTKRITKPVSATTKEQRTLKELRKELHLQSHHSRTKDIHSVQKELLQKYSAPKEVPKPEPEPIQEAQSRPLPEPETLDEPVEENPSPSSSWDDVLEGDTALQAKITELQSTLDSLEQIDTASKSISKKSESQVNELVDHKSAELHTHINELEPQMIKNYITFAKRKGTSESKIIETLVNLGFDNSSIQNHLQSS